MIFDTLNAVLITLYPISLKYINHNDCMQINDWYYDASITSITLAEISLPHYSTVMMTLPFVMLLLFIPVCGCDIKLQYSDSMTERWPAWYVADRNINLWPVYVWWLVTMADDWYWLWPTGWLLFFLRLAVYAYGRWRGLASWPLNTGQPVSLSAWLSARRLMPG